MAERFVVASALCASLFIAGCDGLTGPDYKGVSLATIRGELVSELEDGVPDAKVVLVRQNQVENVYHHASADITSTDFPTSFQIDVFEPPTEDLMTDITRVGEPPQPRIAWALITIMRRDAELGTILGEDNLRQAPEEGGEPMLLGATENHALLYLEDDAAAGSRVAEFLGGPVAAGYHVVSYSWPTLAEWTMYWECVPGGPPCDVPMPTVRWAHGPELGARLRTPLLDGVTACSGGFAAWAAELEPLTLAAEVGLCRDSAANAIVDAVGWESTFALRVERVLDLPWLSVAGGASGGGALIAQLYTTRGEAPHRLTGAATLGAHLALARDLPGGFAVALRGEALVYSSSAKVVPTPPRASRCVSASRS